MLLACAFNASADAQRMAHPASDSSTPPAAAIEKKVSFLNDVEPILTRAGCNQGACHGSQFGKGGFKLSLAAYDPQFDHESIVRMARGRRVSLTAPTESLLLRKPSLEVTHFGGRLVPHGSDDYRAIEKWLGQGAPGPIGSDPRVVGLIASPSQRILRPGGEFQITVRARYSDGTVRDVTAHTRINSLNDRIAAATPEGRVTAHFHGATAIMLRYDGLAEATRIVVPYELPTGLEHEGRSADAPPNPQFWGDHPASSPTSPPNLGAGGRTFVDRCIEKQWHLLRIQPSGNCTDSEFIRRASLDIIGTLPRPEEVREFEADTTAGKDARLIDRLLSRPEYADYWALKWGDLLRNSRGALGEKAMWAYRNWIRDSLYRNLPYDRFVRQILTAEGGAFSEPASNYFRVVGSPQELGEGTAQVFLGVRLQCARCHHHPFEKWSQADYYQFAAFFARVGVKEVRETGSAFAEPTIQIAASGEVTHPKTGLTMTPAPLGSQGDFRAGDAAQDPDATGDRRKLLADWLTSPQNKMFSRELVNRYWGYFLGRGIVQPVDDMRVTNPPVNPQLLDALAGDFSSHGFDLKRLIRTICTARVYRLSSRPTPSNRDDDLFCSHFPVRRQPAEVLLDSIGIATGSQEKFAGLPRGLRAIQLPDASVAAPFLDTFGRPPRTTSCECERAMEPSLSQSLQLLNGELVNRKVAAPGGTIDRLLASVRSDAQLVDALYYAALSRRPRPSELQVTIKVFAAAPSRRQAAEDLLWALINTSEFSEVR